VVQKLEKGSQTALQEGSRTTPSNDPPPCFGGFLVLKEGPGPHPRPGALPDVERRDQSLRPPRPRRAEGVLCRRFKQRIEQQISEGNMKPIERHSPKTGRMVWPG